MEEEAEILDWDEDEEQQTAAATAVDDADGVSLGSDSGDEQENVVAPPSTTIPGPSRSSPEIPEAYIKTTLTSQASSVPSHPVREDSNTVSNSSSGRKDEEENHGRSRSPVSKSRKRRKGRENPPPTTLPKPIHNLPAKPVTSTVPYPSSSSIEPIAMSRSKGSNVKPVSSSSGGNDLPPEWEIRYSRSCGDAVYYYNTQTHESTWEKPLQAEYKKDRSALSYEDRHYRPGEDHDTSGPASLDVEGPSSTRRSGKRAESTTDAYYGHPHGPSGSHDGDSDDSPYRGRSHPARARSDRRSRSPSPHRSRDMDVDIRGARDTSHRQHDRVSRRANNDRDYDDRHYDSYRSPIASVRRRANSDDHSSRPKPDYDQDISSSGPPSKSGRREEVVLSTQTHETRPNPSYERSRDEERKSRRGPSPNTRRRANSPRGTGSHNSRDQRQPQNVSSINRHRSRSPPPHVAPAIVSPAVELPSTTAGSKFPPWANSNTGRKKPSRFAPAALDAEQDDPLVPDEFKTDTLGGDRQKQQERGRSRSRESIHRAKIDKDEPQYTRRGSSRRDRTPSPEPPTQPRKREPLPPQSERFREASRRPAVPSTSDSHGSANLKRDPPPHRPRLSTTNSSRMDVDVPIGPRSSLMDAPTGPRARSRSPHGADANSALRAGAGMYADRVPSNRDDDRRVSDAKEKDKARDVVDTAASRNQGLPPTGPRGRARSPPGRGAENGLKGSLPPPPAAPVSPRGRDSGRRSRARRGREVTGSNNIPVGVRQPHSETNLRNLRQSPTIPNPSPPAGLSATLGPLTNTRNRGVDDGDDSDPALLVQERRREPPMNYERNRSVDDGDDSDPVILVQERRREPPMNYKRESDRDGRRDSPRHSPNEWRHDRERDPPRYGRREASPSYGDKNGRYRQPTPPPLSREPSETSPRDDRDLDRREPPQRRPMRNGDEREAKGDRSPDKESHQNGFKHPLPMNPLLRLGNSPTVSSARNSNQGSGPRYDRDRDRLPRMDADVLTRDVDDAPSRQSKPPIKIRRPPPLAQELSNSSSLPDTPMAVDEGGNGRNDDPQRPAPMRRGSTLLDRLSIDRLSSRAENPLTPSLRDRVQVPSKRDRDDMMDDERHRDNRGGRYDWDAAEDRPGVGEHTGSKRRRRGARDKRPRKAGKV